MISVNAAGKHHREQMRANYSRLEEVTGSLLSFVERVEEQHHAFYRRLLEELEQSESREDFVTYQNIDLQYTQQLAALQAARERMIEATAHMKRAIVHPGDRLAHLKNVTPESF